MTAIADKLPVEASAFANRLRTGCLLRWFRHRRHHIRRSWKWIGCAQLECEQARRPALGLRCGHRPRRSKQARARAPSHRYQDILLAIRRISNRNRFNCRPGLKRPCFLPSVRGERSELAGTLALEHKISRGRQYSTVCRDLLFDGPAFGLSNRIPGDEPSFGLRHPLAGFDRSMSIGLAVGRRNVDQTLSRLKNRRW